MIPRSGGRPFAVGQLQTKAFALRDAGLTRHPGLAEAAAIVVEMKANPAIVRRRFKEMIPAFLFVMAGFANRPGRTAL